MIKRLVRYTFFALFFSFIQSQAFSAQGPLFNVVATGTPANLNITLCLSPGLSCETFVVTASTLSIQTTVNHTYTKATIQINTPGYSCDTAGHSLCSLAMLSSSNSVSVSVTSNNGLSIIDISPNTGSTDGGQRVNIYYTPFQAGEPIQVTIGGNSAKVAQVVSGFVTVSTPPGSAGSASVIVTTSAGSNPPNTLYTYVAPTPTITSILPSEGTTAGGTTVNITGTELSGVTAVLIGGEAATELDVVSSTSITAVTPAHVDGAASVVVFTPYSHSIDTLNFTYIPPSAPPPSVSSISPNTGSTAGGTSVTISGANFIGATAVTIGGSPVTSFVPLSDTSITVITPSGSAGQASVVVTTPSGSNAANALYTYVPPPTVISVTPSTGSTVGGTVITITGTNFTGATGVTLSKADATNVLVVNGETITAVTPMGSAGAASVVVTTPYGRNAENEAYTYLSPSAPTVTNLAPNYGTTAGGTLVTITGTNFTGVTRVTFGGVAATNTALSSDTTITTRTPSGAVGEASVVVTTPEGSSTSGLLFTYQAISTNTVLYSSVNPSQEGTSVTFSANVSSASGTPTTGTVQFTTDGTTIAGCSAQSLSSGVATCSTTSLSAATHPIVAIYSGANGFSASTSATFSQYVVTTVVVTSPAPPTDITVVPGYARVTVSWFPPANTGGSNLSELTYHIHYGATGTGAPSFLVASCAGSSGSPMSPCVVEGLGNGDAYTFTVQAVSNNGISSSAYSSSITPSAGPLVASTPVLALSVNKAGTYPALTGYSRTLIITNIGGTSEQINSVMATGLPNGTTITSDTCSNETLAVFGTCAITITPGTTASCAGGMAPVAGSLTVSFGGDAVSSSVVVLDYGCLYQSGLVFSIDDTMPTIASVGGTVVSSTDNSSSTDWSGDTSSIWGIAETPTIGIPVPGLGTVPIGELNCNGSTDGSCDTNNLFAHYSPATTYAANVCKQIIDNLTDWYLPSICEMGYFTSDSESSTCGMTPGIIQNIQLALVDGGVNGAPSGSYWSSTEFSGSFTYSAWMQDFALGSSLQSTAVKGAASSVRCARALTL